MTDSVKTFVDEAIDFTKRNPTLNDVGQTFGGLTWGAMRAVAECPDDPGVFRIPFDATGSPGWPVGGDWKYLRCPHCGQVWTFDDTEPAPPEPKRKRGRR